VKKVLMILVLVTSIAAVVGIGAKLDARFAKADVVSAVSERLDNKILRDRRDAIQERLWKLEDRHAEQFWADKGRAHKDIEELVAWMDQDSRDRWRRLVAALEEVEKELERRAKEEEHDED